MKNVNGLPCIYEVRLTVFKTDQMWEMDNDKVTLKLSVLTPG